jgi:hypothetical protein
MGYPLASSFMKRVVSKVRPMRHSLDPIAKSPEMVQSQLTKKFKNSNPKS